MSQPAAYVPGPSLPRILQSWLGVTRPVKARLAMRERYGSLFQSNDLIAGQMFHVADRELVAQMFKWKPADYDVAEPRELMAPVLGSASLLLLDGDRHMRMRKLMLPPFHGDAVAGYSDVIAEITHAEMSTWRVGDKVRTRTLAQRITMEVIIRTVFGITDPERIAELRRLLPRLSSISPLVLLLRNTPGRFGPWASFIRHRDRVDALLYEEITRRRTGASDGSARDILGLLLEARDEHGAPLTDAELRDEVITLLLAGHETTATSIGWAFERLLRTPLALTRLSEELERGGGSEYLDAVIKETLRVRPVVTEVFRAPSRPIEFGGYRFDAGAQLAASLMLIQYDPELFPEPFVFRPERFLEGAPDSYTWIPFGGGVRRCIGAAFAQLEMKVVIATILSRAKLRAPRSKPEVARFRGITLLPSRGGEAIIEALG